MLAKSARYVLVCVSAKTGPCPGEDSPANAISPAAPAPRSVEDTDNTSRRRRRSEEGGERGNGEGCGGVAELAGFLHYRYLVDDGDPVLYVYEIQVRKTARREWMPSREDATHAVT